MTDAITVIPTRAGSLIIEAPYCTRAEAANVLLTELGVGRERVIIPASDLPGFAIKLLAAWAEAQMEAAPKPAKVSA